MPYEYTAIRAITYQSVPSRKGESIFFSNLAIAASDASLAAVSAGGFFYFGVGNAMDCLGTAIAERGYEANAEAVYAI